MQNANPLLPSPRNSLLYYLEFTDDIPVNWQIETAPKSHKALKYFPLFENLMQFCNDGLAGSNIPSRSKLTRMTESPAILKSSSGKLGLKREADYSNNMIGYPSGQDGAVSCPLGIRALSRKENLLCFSVLSHVINLLLTKLARPRQLDIDLVLFCLFMDLAFISVHMQKKNLANIQPS